MKSVFDEAFAQYGRVITGHNFAPLLDALRQKTQQPANGTIYVAGDPMLESLEPAKALAEGVFGGMPVEIGYCNGSNKKLNCLEYHRDSEVDIPADDIVLLVAPRWKLREGKLNTAAVEAFTAPAGTALELYATTLHYAPCNAPGKDGFRMIVALPRGTNTEKPPIAVKDDEDRLLWARNKWLIAHPDSDEARQGAFVGLEGNNITVE